MKKIRVPNPYRSAKRRQAAEWQQLVAAAERVGLTSKVSASWAAEFEQMRRSSR